MPAPDRNSLIDRVDERDQPAGQVKRGDVLAVGANFRTAHVFVLRDSNHLLLQRLATTRGRHPGRWGSSVAGYLHAGETYKAAARRRMVEEIGLRTPLRTVGKVSMRDEHSQKFVTLFAARSQQARNSAPDQIADLAFWPILKLQVAVRENPEGFTPTFLELFSFFRRRHPVP